MTEPFHMNSTAEILSSPVTDDAPKAVLCIGFDEQALEIVKPLISQGLILRTISFIDPLAKINSEIDSASIVFIQWDGIGKKAHTILLSREKKSQNQGVAVHLLLRNKITTPALAPKQAKELGIASWIEVPQKYFEIQRLLFDLTGSQDPEDDAQTRALAGGAESPPSLLRSKTLTPTGVSRPQGTEPHTALDARSQTDKKGSNASLNRTTEGDEEGSSVGRRVPELNLPVPHGSDLETSMRRIVEAWKNHASDEEALIRQNKPLARERLVVVHPGEAFATEIAGLLEECGVKHVRKPRTIDETMAELRRQATGILIWFDGSSRMIASLLEHLTESRQLTYIPILVILPSRDVAEQLGAKLRGYFFDAICFYDRKTSTIATALESLKRASLTSNTPRSVLEQLRQPLKIESPPEKRRAVPLTEMEVLANKLSERPGKRYWGLSELIPHSIIAGDINKSIHALKEISTLRPSAFNTLVLRALVARQTPKKDEAAEFLARTALKIPDITADRLFRVAQMLERWKAQEALSILLNGWADLPELRQDPQLSWMAGRYYLITKEIPKAVPFLAQAAAIDPMRTDYAEGIARILATNHHYDRAANILRYVTTVKDCPWDGKILYPHVLVQSRNIKEASTVLTKLLSEAPDNRELLSIKTKINL
jgi:tetratricopeptide (TPR) repeat protein